MKLIFTTLLVCLFSASAAATEWVQLSDEQSALVIEAVQSSMYETRIGDDCPYVHFDEDRRRSTGEADLNPTSHFDTIVVAYENKNSAQPLMSLVSLDSTGPSFDDRMAVVTTSDDFRTVTKIVYTRKIGKFRDVRKNAGTIKEPNFVTERLKNVTYDITFTCEL